MKTRYFVLFFMLLAFAYVAFGQDAKQPRQAEITYIDASIFPVYGKAYADDGPRYRRFPTRLHGVVRDTLWNLGCNSAGLYIRFRTDAPEIHALWSNTGYSMPHMTLCGVGGLDLYAFLDGEWRFVGSGFDSYADSQTEHYRKLVGSMEPQMREYMLYLSLYDDVRCLELGVPAGYVIEQPVLGSPRSESPIVMYGTSILQGGCASRPGMAHTNIIARRLDRTVINLGFSGNAFLDMDVARLMAEVEHPSVFVLDYVPNATAKRIEARGEAFFRLLRDRHPDVPVVFVEEPQFAHSVVNQATAKEILSRNGAQRALFQSLKDAGETNIYYVDSRGMTTSEDFVDGVHLTDLGMLHYADFMVPVLRKVLSAGK